MGFGKKVLLFSGGGLAYVGLELLWRGRSHGSMFLAGGSCFMLLGQLGRHSKSLLVRGIGGSCIITGVELATGLLTNRQYKVWDYRSVPFNYKGQICLSYSLLWIPVGLAGILLYEGSERLLSKKRCKIKNNP